MSRYELTLLDNAPDSPARVLYSAEDSSALVFTDGSGEEGPSRRVRIEPAVDGGVRWVEESREDGAWRPFLEGRFGPPG